jgi:hypothetical protein
MQKVFFNAFAEELTKLASCGKPHGKKKTKVPPQYLSKRAAKKEKMVYCPVRKKMVPVSETRGKPGRGLGRGGGKGPMGMPKKAMDDGAGAAQPHANIKAKIEAARRDPSTKKNPHDTGPKGSGTQDPRFKGMKFTKKASAKDLLEIIKQAMKTMVSKKMKPKRVTPVPTNIRRGSSRVPTGRGPSTSPIQEQVNRWEGQQFFKDLAGRAQ